MIEALSFVTLLSALFSDYDQAWHRVRDGRRVGFRAMRYDAVRHVAVSGANSRLHVPLISGRMHQMPGRGFFITNSSQHAVDYYAIHDQNVLLAYAFHDADVTGGNLEDRAVEISVRQGELLGYTIGEPETDE